MCFVEVDLEEDFGMLLTEILWSSFKASNSCLRLKWIWFELGDNYYLFIEYL